MISGGQDSLDRRNQILSKTFFRDVASGPDFERLSRDILAALSSSLSLPNQPARLRK